MRYVTLDDAPEFRAAFSCIETSWPTFMEHDPVAARLYREMGDLYPRLQGLLLDDDDRPVAKSHATAFLAPDRAEDLPDRGWDAVMEQGVADGRAGRTPTAVSAIEVAVAPAARGRACRA